MPAAEYLTLAPPLVEAGKFNELVKAGQTVSSTFSSFDNSFAVFITNVVRKPMSEKTIIQFNFFPQVAPTAAKGPTREDEQPIYFASLNSPPSSERRLVSQQWWFVEILIHFFSVPYRHPHNLRRFSKSVKECTCTRTWLVTMLAFVCIVTST